MAASEKERMLAGELYRAGDPQLVAERRAARTLVHQFNATGPDELELRRALLGRLLGGIGGRILIEPPFHCDYGYNITVGDGLEMNFNCVILDCAPVAIGARVLIAPAVQICAATHPTDAAIRREGRELAKPIRIEDDVWIGAGAVIGPGVTIGRNAVIGAGSVVTRDIPADVVAAGNPARVVRRLGG